MVLKEAYWKVERCVLCSSLTVNIPICLSDFRSFLYGLVGFSNALTIHCKTEYSCTCSLLNTIPSKNFVLLPPIWQLINCILYSSLLRRHSVSETAVMRVSTDSTCILSVVPWCEETKGNHREQSLDCMQDVQRLSSPSPAAKPGCHDSDVVSLSEGRWWHHFATSVIFWMEDRPHIIMQHNSTICVTDWSVRWDCVVQPKFCRGEKHNTYHFQSPSTISMQLSSCWHSRVPFCNLTPQFWIMLVQPQSIHC